MEVLNGCTYLLIFIIFVNEIIISKCDYCDLSHVPACLNKPHVLCDPIGQFMEIKITNYILQPLNKLRRELAHNQSICNLHDFTLNTDFEKIAYQLLRKPDDLCTMTNYSKNIVVIRRTIPYNESVGSIIKTFLIYISQEPDYKSWTISAYSTNIGCGLISFNVDFGKIICITNGIKLNNYEQSYGYNQECRTNQHKFQNKTCYNINSTCKEHFICRKHNFGDLQPISIEFSTIRYILYKFEQKQHKVTWNYGLQYFAERIVVQNLTEHDKCVAKEQYEHIKPIHLKGVQYFSEQISNIDNIWQNVDVEGDIGCALFNSNISGIIHINAYCLTVSSFSIIKTQQCTDITLNCLITISTPWLQYAVPVLIVIDICEIIILFCLKCYIKNILQILSGIENDMELEPHYEQIL